MLNSYIHTEASSQLFKLCPIGLLCRFPRKFRFMLPPLLHHCWLGTVGWARDVEGGDLLFLGLHE